MSKSTSHNILIITYWAFDDALIQLEKSVRHNPGLISARFNLAKLLLKLKKDTKKAKMHIKAALALKPNSEQKQTLKALLNQTNNQ